MFLFSCRSAKQQVERQPKLFFVSTSSTTSTLKTASVCYATTATFAGACTGRKRRAINFDGASADESELKLSRLKEDVQSSKEDEKLERENRFLLHRITTTSISPSFKVTPSAPFGGRAHSCLTQNCVWGGTFEDFIQICKKNTQ